MPHAAPRHNPLARPVAQHAPERDQFPSCRRWRRLRAMVLREQPLCSNLLGLHRPGETVESTQVHHVEPRRLRPDLAFVRSNLRALCASCHSRITAHAMNLGKSL